MKIWKKILTSVLAVALMVSLSNGTALAAKENYYYTITFLAGNQGVFVSTDGLSVEGANAVVNQTADKIVVTGLSAGDIVSFNAQAAVSLVETSKHYVQGVRLSGRDNDTVSDSVFTVDSDKDYVVAYGIQGNMTSYTVNYQDASGSTIAPTETFYGNVGDKPVVAYKYIEGYMPRVLGFTKTLSENEAENVFTFVYDKVVVENNTQNNRPGSATPGGTFDPQTPDSDDDDVQVEEDNKQTDDKDKTKPSDIVDLDDEETPLGNVDIDDKDGGKGIPLAGMIAMVIIALVALANILFFFGRKQKK